MIQIIRSYIDIPPRGSRNQCFQRVWLAKSLGVGHADMVGWRILGEFRQVVLKICCLNLFHEPACAQNLSWIRPNLFLAPSWQTFIDYGRELVSMRLALLLEGRSNYVVVDQQTGGFLSLRRALV